MNISIIHLIFGEHTQKKSLLDAYYTKSYSFSKDSFSKFSNLHNYF